MYIYIGFQKPESSFIWNITEDDGLSIGICQQANIRVPNEEDWKGILIFIYSFLPLRPSGTSPRRGGTPPRRFAPPLLSKEGKYSRPVRV